MTDKVISPLRQRLINDMTIRRFGSQDTAPLYPPRQKLCGFPWPVSRQGHRGGRPSVPAVAGVDRSNVPTVNAGASALRFFFKVTL